MQKFPTNWSLEEKINYLQRKIILNSIAYYIYDTSPLSDKSYDSLCCQLVDLQKRHNDISKTQYGYIMYDFDGTTGFDLYYRLTDEDRNYLLKIARGGLGI